MTVFSLRVMHCKPTGMHFSGVEDDTKSHILMTSTLSVQTGRSILGWDGVNHRLVFLADLPEFLATRLMPDTVQE